jgi:hypothetical protein
VETWVAADAWETNQLVDTSYTDATNERRPIPTSIEITKNRLLQELSGVFDGSDCQHCKKGYKMSIDLVEHHINILVEWDIFRNRCLNLEREIERYLDEIHKYKTIAETALLRRNGGLDEPAPTLQRRRRRNT